MKTTEGKTHLSLALLTALIIGFSNIAFAQEQEAAKTNAVASLGLFEKNSFAPTRGETFLIQITLNSPEKLKKTEIEIRSSDDDLIQTLAVKDLKASQKHYEVLWDGKDSTGEIVPNEAYFPILKLTSLSDKTDTIDTRTNSGGEEVFDFEKNIGSGSIEYTLPIASRILIRAGIKNGPMLRTLIDWEPRTAGFHAERWNGQDLDKTIAIEQNPKSSYLIIGYQLPRHSIITYANAKESYRAYRERKKLPVQKPEYGKREIERAGKTIRPEFYNPVLQQKSPRINVSILDIKTREEKIELSGFDEIITQVKLHPLDEIYLDQERYEISFFVDNEFIAEEEQGFVPFTWRWSPGRQGIKPGKHVLTVNVSGYNGQVGVKNMSFTLQDKK
jgi:hypothetical protein